MSIVPALKHSLGLLAFFDCLGLPLGSGIGLGKCPVKDPTSAGYQKIALTQQEQR